MVDYTKIDCVCGHKKEDHVNGMGICKICGVKDKVTGYRIKHTYIPNLVKYMPFTIKL